MSTFSSSTDVSSAINSVYSEIFKITVQEDCKEPYVRPSACPACALPLFIEITEGRIKKEFLQDQDFFKEYYTEVGNVTHALLQKWIGRTGRLLGDWKCKCSLDKEGNPKIVRRMSTNNKCPECGKEAEYSELEFNVKGITGHVDGILKFKIKGKVFYIVIDFKGSSTLNLNKNKSMMPPKYPTKKNAKQISMYAHIFRNYYDLNIIGWGLIYTARDTPKQYLICPKFYTKKNWKEAEDLFESQVMQHNILEKTLKDGNINRLLKHKLCEDHDHYTLDIKDQYKACPLAAFCFSNKTKLKDTLEEAYANYAKTLKSTKLKKR